MTTSHMRPFVWLELAGPDLGSTRWRRPVLLPLYRCDRLRFQVSCARAFATSLVVFFFLDEE